MMWELYERLIEPIPDDVPVDEILVGTSCTMVRAGGAAGAAANQRLESRPRILGEGEWEQELTWRQAASLINSWNFLEAGIGAAAINAYYNRKDVLMNGIAAYEGVKILESCDTFAAPGDGLAGKKVATIGHFHYAERYLKKAGELFVLERDPREGDYPDTACEYILPGMDYIYITGFTLVNKTLPRLLELGKNARVVLVGPSVPMAPVLFEFGVRELAGTLITDTAKTERLVRFGSHRAVVRSGIPVRAGYEE